MWRFKLIFISHIKGRLDGRRAGFERVHEHRAPLLWRLPLDGHLALEGRLRLLEDHRTRGTDRDSVRRRCGGKESGWRCFGWWWAMDFFLYAIPVLIFKSINLFQSSRQICFFFIIRVLIPVQGLPATKRTTSFAPTTLSSRNTPKLRRRSQFITELTEIRSEERLCPVWHSSR